MRVEICAEPAAWDAYVTAHPGASNYHRWLWKRAIEATFSHEPYYLMAYGRQGTEGVLPLFAVRSRLFGRSLISMPFFSYGGVLASNDEARSQLLEEAIRLARRLKVQRVELRQGDELGDAWHGESAKVNMCVPLPATPDHLWKALSTGLRNKIRYAEKHGLKAQWGGAELVASFYSLFAVNMRNLGTPVYPRAWFENLCTECPEIRVLVLADDGAPVAGAFLVPYRDTLELPWSASLPPSRRKYAHVFLYWAFLSWAIQNGFRTMDLGRCTPGGGTYEFKRHWMCEERRLCWCYWLADGASMPARADERRFQLPIGIWKRLPLPVANFLGPRIVRSIP